MCRNIKTLFNFDPPATEDELRASSLQFVRKLSGFSKPSKANEVAFNQAVDRWLTATDAEERDNRKNKVELGPHRDALLNKSLPAMVTFLTSL